MVFTLHAADGTPRTAAQANLQALYLDRNGNAAFVDNNILARSTPGEYQSRFNLNNNWQGAAGPVTIHVVWKGVGTARSLPTQIFHNHLDTTLQTDVSTYNPGDTVSFSGTVAQLNTVATSDLETTPLTGSQVSVRLVDSNGNTLAHRSIIHGPRRRIQRQPSRTRNNTRPDNTPSRSHLH